MIRSVPGPSADDVIVVIAHPAGDVEASLRQWIELGPGPRELLRPVVAIHRGTRERLPISVVPWRYRNTWLSRMLIKIGVLRNPWV